MEDSSSSTAEQSERKEKVKARWGILRTALVRSAQEEQQRQKHSIHRFAGYNLLKARPGDSTSREIEQLLTEYQWGHVKTETWEGNLDQVVTAILAMSTCFPTGKCMKIRSMHDKRDKESGLAYGFSDKWIETIKQRCQPSVQVWKVSEEVKEQTSALVTIVTTLLVQETSNSTKYQTLEYDFHDENDLSGTENNNGDNVKCCDILWTREPKEIRLSLDDLVSHRKNKGVDNTGNICVWDSERTLAYLLYKHFDDFDEFSTLLKHEVCDKNMSLDVGGNGKECQQWQFYKNTNLGIRILELGTGMAGLSAVSLGLRLAIRQRGFGFGKSEVENIGNDTVQTRKTRDIHVTLTDGNANGVKNNAINQYLTKLNSQIMVQQRGVHSNYFDLDVKCDTLLWTTGVGSDSDDEKIMRHRDQDVVLISDCVHFQNFHAALATTTLRCLRVGGCAIFCQPTRGPSLDNFFNLLSTVSSNTDSIGLDPLLSRSWMSHPVIDKKHEEAISQYNSVYDENLHRPKILMVTKLREISEDDILRFIAYQERYSSVKP